MKNDYNKNYFRIIKDPESLENKFYLKPKGQLVEVDEDVFRVCYNSYKKIMRDNSKDNRLKMMSLDSQFVDGITYIDMIADNKSIDVEDQYKVTMILDEIDKLSPDDKELITNLLVQEKTERELAKQLHVS